MEDYRQKITYKILLEVIAIAALLWAFYPWLCYDSIDFPAQVDGWGGRSSLLRMPSIALLFYIGLSVLQKFPEIYNYSCEVTEENEDYLYRMGVSLVRYLKIILVFIFAYRNNEMYAGAMGKFFVHSNLVIILSIAVLFLIITIYAIKMKRYKLKTQQIMKNYQKRTTYYKILEVVAIAASLWAFYPLLFYNSIDNNTLVPIHYNFFGEVNGWGGRFFLWVLPLIGLAHYIGLSIVEKYPRFINYPRKVTEQNADYLHKMGIRLVRHIKVLVALLFAYLNNASYSIAMGKGVGLNNFIIMPLMAGLLLLVIIYTIKMLRYKPKTQQIMKNHQKTSAYDKILEVIAVVALLWAFYPLLYYYNIDINAEFPIHYNIAGEVDNWGGRSSLWNMPLIALFMYVLLSVSQILARKFPNICNYPCEETEQNADYLNRMMVQLLRSIKIPLVFIMAYGSNDIYAGAMGKAFAHSGFVVILSIVGMFLIITIYTVKMKRYKPQR